MVVGEASIHNIMGGMESTGGVRLHNHKRKLKQRFDIIKKLGQGTYGKVQLGINKETGQEVAIKTIKKCKIETEADLIRIRREIQIMSSVQHPNIIHIYEVFENREKMVLVMEYAAGGELYDYLSERKVLSEHEARRIFRQISTAVFYCHKHKICHRDLKLENILLDQNKNAKIADFGLSNVFDDQRLLSTFCGSPLYASPEIVKGTPYHGPEVDCWSLGVLLYTLVYGAMPFDGSNFKRLVKQISQSDYFEPKKPSPASPLIKEMLTVCPRRRADVEKICTHWWVNEGYEQNCLDIAEDLAAQTPVRLDLLLSLVPQSASADKLVVGDQSQPAPADIANSMSTETLVPTRCHSVGSLMELDQNNSDRRIREMVEEEANNANEAAAAVTSDAKRKLETTPSMDETIAAGVKRKERTKKREGTEDRDPRAYRSTSKHHSAPIPNSILEEAMEVDPTVVAAVPTSKTVDIDKLEDSASCLEVKAEERKEKSPSKEKRETLGVSDKPQSSTEEGTMTNNKDQITTEEREEKNEVVAPITPEKEIEQNVTELEKPPESPEKIIPQSIVAAEKESEVPKEKSPAKMIEVAGDTVPEQKNESRTDETNEKQQTKEFRKIKNRALSLDSEIIAAESAPKPSTERRRSKIFETAEKFNQLLSPVEPEPKPKKIFIPGVNVGGAKAAFERKASLSSVTVPQTLKAPVSKVIIDVPAVDKTPENEKPQEIDNKDQEKKREEEKKRAVDIITGALGKPPMQRRASGGSPPISPQSNDAKKLGLKIPVGPNDVRNATVTVTTPVETKFPFELKQELQARAIPVSPDESRNDLNNITDEPNKCSKMEITLKSATLPRPRKTSKAEITLSNVRPIEGAFRSEVEAKIDAFHPQKLRTQRSEVAFPVAAVIQQSHRSSSLEPETQSHRISFKERIIPIQVEPIPQTATVHSTTPPPKPPMAQRSLSQRSNSLSRQSTADSDTDSALGSTMGPEPIRKSPREYIIPIAVEGGGYVTPRSGSVEPESKNSTPTSTNPPRARFGRPRRMGSLLSDASEDESPFSTLHRDNDDLLQRHMHRLRSSRPTRPAPEHADSLSSGEEDDDDGFELLTAENLFSTLLSRVRSLTQRLNVDDNRNTTFPSSRLLGRMGSNSPQSFWGMHEPLSSYESYFESETVTTRISDSQFRRSVSRENNDRFSRKDSSGSNTPQQNSPGARTPSRDSLFDMGSNTLPRAKSRSSAQNSHASTPTPTPQEAQPPSGASSLAETESGESRNFTPCLARRLSRQFIEKTRQPLPRSPSLPRERIFRSSPTREPSSSSFLDVPSSNSLERYRSRSHDRSFGSMRRANSLLEASVSGHERRLPARRSISLFDDEDRYLPPIPRQSVIGGLGRKYRDSGKLSTTSLGIVEKIQEEQPEDVQSGQPQIPRIIRNDDFDSNSITENNSLSECPSFSLSNCLETTSSRSAISGETSPTESTSNILDYSSSYKNNSNLNSSASTKELQNKLLAVENLIKESKLKNLGMSKYNANLSSNYKDLDKCDKESFSAISDSASAAIAKRRSCIPSLRFRSGSLTRDSSLSRDRSKPYSEDTMSVHALTPERSLLSKFFRSSSSKDVEIKDKSEAQQKPKQRRISRFLRPDFFDTPREESQYVKDKEAAKAAENERRKSRFMKRKTDSKNQSNKAEDKLEDEKLDKQLKNEVNSLTKVRSETPSRENKTELINQHVDEEPKIVTEKPSIKNSFLQTLEKKLEKFRSGDDSTSKTNNNIKVKPVEEDVDKVQSAKENSVLVLESSVETQEESTPIKRATSAEDLSADNSSVSTQGPVKVKKNSVLGLFKNSEPKVDQNGAPRTQGQTILSRLRKNPYKGSRSDGVLTADASATSKIPTKFAKNETKSTKKIVEAKKSPEKTTFGFKRSPSKDKEKEQDSTTPKRISPETKKPTMERLSKSLKKSPEKVTKGKTEKSSEIKKDASTGKISEKKKSTEKTTIKKNISPEKSFLKAKSPERIIDNKQLEDMNGETEEKAVSKLKKKVIVPSTSLSENSSSTKSDKSDNVKKVKKIVKTKESSEKDKEGGDGTKKKKIVRVVRKVVKKSPDNSDSKSEEKDQDKATTKTTIKKTIVAKKDKSPDVVAQVNNFQQTKSPENRIFTQKESTSEMKSVEKEPSSDLKQVPKESSPELNSVLTESSPDPKPMQKENSPELKYVPTANENSSNHDNEEKMEKEKTPLRAIKSPSPVTSYDIGQPRMDEIKANREKLKLDFSKIPQHSFRNITPPRRVSPKSETPKSETSEIPKLVRRSQSDDASSKLMDRLSKMAHRASITENKIVMDKPMLKSEIGDPRDASARDSNFEENHVELRQPVEEMPILLNSKSSVDTNNSAETKERKMSSSSKDPLSTDELLSPTEDTESFDSWSICSADINYTRSDLHSPTSPTYSSMYSRGSSENPPTESVIDRIRRKSFYSRFNDRKRKASLNAPPPGINVSSSMTLPRKFSFHSSRDSGKEKQQQQKKAANNYAEYSAAPSVLPSRKSSDKSYSSYQDDVGTYRKSPIERDRYSDGGSASSYTNELKSPSDSYGHISSSYDPMRKYLSPTFDSGPARRKYHSTEFNSDNDFGSYRNSPIETSITRNISSLPRRFGSSKSGFEPKTVEYFEGLLAPNNTDYLGGRRASPLPHENFGKYENGYHNGSIDLPPFNADKWRSHSDKPARTDFGDTVPTEPRTRKVSQCISEPDDLSSSSLDQRMTTSTAE